MFMMSVSNNVSSFQQATRLRGLLLGFQIDILASFDFSPRSSCVTYLFLLQKYILLSFLSCDVYRTCKAKYMYNSFLRCLHSQRDFCSTLLTQSIVIIGVVNRIKSDNKEFAENIQEKT